MPDSGSNSNTTVVIKDLPIYADPPKLEDYHFVEDGLVLGQALFARLRSMGQNYSTIIKERLGIVNKSLEPVKEVANATEDYVRREKDWLPLKAFAIAVGGASGLVMAMRRGGMLRRALYPATGIATMTAFCFPHETVHVVRTGVAHSRMAWENFKQSPEPNKKS